MRKNKRIYYIPGNDCIEIANDIFGPTGWSSEFTVLDTSIEQKGDQFHVNSKTKVSARVGNGCHSVNGYGTSVSSRSFDAVSNAERIACTDGLKGALKLYGNVFGLFIRDSQFSMEVYSNLDDNQIYRKNMFSLPLIRAPAVSHVLSPSEGRRKHPAVKSSTAGELDRDVLEVLMMDEDESLFVDGQEPF